MRKDQTLLRANLGLLTLAKHLGNVAKMMGYTRDAFYRLQEPGDAGGGQSRGSTTLFT